MTKKKQFTSKDFHNFKELFMGAAVKLGLTEWSFHFFRIDDEDTTACVQGDTCQKSMCIRFANSIEDTGQDKLKIIVDAAEHEAIETLLYHLRIGATDEKGRMYWDIVDGHCHTIINRIQYLVFPEGWYKGIIKLK